MLFMVAVLIMTVSQDSTQSFSGNVGLLEDVRLEEAGETPIFTAEEKAALIADRFKIAAELKRIRSISLSRTIKSLLYGVATVKLTPKYKLANHWFFIMDQKEDVGARGKIPLWENVRAIAPSDTAGTWDKAIERRNALIKAFTR